MSPPSRARRFVFGAILASGVLLVAESAAFVLAWRIATLDVVDLRPVLRRRLRAGARSSQPLVGLHRELYDPDLGWVYKKGYWIGPPGLYAYDDSGARVAPRPFPTTRVSTYGDSFTHGDHVAAHETWSQRLAERLGTNVLNFGVGGYGTDQALLRLEKNLAAGRATEVVVLAICSENVNRVISHVRAFYTNADCLPCATNGPKPMFARTAAGFRLLPAGAAPSVEEFEAAVDRAREADFWYRGLSFPYTLGVLRWYARGERQLHCGPRCMGRWDLPRARAVMLYLLKRFAALARSRRFRPVVVVLPCGTDFAAVAAGEAPGYRRLLDEARGAPGLRRVTWVDPLASGPGTLRGYPDSADGWHPGPEGHAAIAAVVAQAIGELPARAAR